MLEGNMNWLTDPPFFIKERGFFITDDEATESLARKVGVRSQGRSHQGHASGASLGRQYIKAMSDAFAGFTIYHKRFAC
jgi:hypothetical protein